MRTEDVRHAVGFQELVHNAGAERIASAPVSECQQTCCQAGLRLPTWVILQSPPFLDQGQTIRGLPSALRVVFLAVGIGHVFVRSMAIDMRVPRNLSTTLI